MAGSLRAILGLCAWAISASALAADALDGVWAGDRLRVTADAQGLRIEADCADGWVVAKPSLAADGSFVARGTYVEHRAGAQSANGRAAQTPARFSGIVQGDTLKLSILPEGAFAERSYLLRRGATVKLLRCV